MTTPTDRYVWAVSRLVPEAQRAEIGAELRAAVADMVDDRVGPDAPPDAVAEAERAALTELGNPRRMAARYADRPRGLIGPELFPEYLRVLRFVATIALPFVVGLSLLAGVLDDVPSNQLVGRVISGLITGTVHIGFWVTLGFACFERLPEGEQWSVDTLPEPPAPSRVSLADTLGSVSVAVVTIAALVLQRTRSPIASDGESVPMLHPDLWDGWMYVVLGVLAASIVVYVAVHLARRWTIGWAAVNAALNAVFLGVVAWVAFDDALANPAFLRALAVELELDRVPELDPLVVVLVLGVIVLWDTVDCFRKAWRTDRDDGAAGSVPVGTRRGGGLHGST